MTILGIGGLGSKDAACAVVVDGAVRAAAEEKKLRGDSRGFPEAALQYCQSIVGKNTINAIAIARPAAESDLATVRAALPGATITLVDHHLAHAASAYFASGFRDAAVLTVDYGSDLTTAQSWDARDERLTAKAQMFWPDSIGGFYSRVTELLGFRPGEDEHKVQWMSTAGDDRFVAALTALLGDPWNSPGRRQALDEENLRSALGLDDPYSIPDSLRPHIAKGLQSAVAAYLAGRVGPGQNLCLAGGVFLNALLVHALESSGRWRNVFVQPAAGNAGTAIGAAYFASDEGRKPMETFALGPEYSAEEIKRVLENCKLRFRYALTTDEVLDTTLKLLADRKIVAWMQGRMEFGPRALGNRSIFASPLDPFSSENLNVYIKHREGFRKFAAAVPAELADEYFETSANARFLASVSRVREPHRKTFAPAILGDDLIRVHSVNAKENPLLHRLLLEVGRMTGLPVLYNTSFNLFGDPLVCSPRDAVRSFYSSGIDALITGHFILEK